MRRTITHDEAHERLEDLALDVAEPDERWALLSHVAECVDCRRDLEALRRTASELAYAVAPRPMPAEQRERVRARLLARAHADVHVDAPGDVHAARLAGVPVQAPWRPRPARRTTLARAAWLTAAASVVALVGLGAMMRRLADKDRTIAALTGPNVTVMRLSAAAPRRSSGMIFWDRARGDWTLVAHNLSMPRAGRGYQVWLVTPRAKISGGMFVPDVHGDAMMRMHYALSADSLAALAVTEEPSVGSPQPTTPPLMVAASTPR